MCPDDPTGEVKFDFKLKHLISKSTIPSPMLPFLVNIPAHTRETKAKSKTRGWIHVSTYPKQHGRRPTKPEKPVSMP
jgi:hypothetical protein